MESKARQSAQAEEQYQGSEEIVFLINDIEELPLVRHLASLCSDACSCSVFCTGANQAPDSQPEDGGLVSFLSGPLFLSRQFCRSMAQARLLLCLGQGVFLIPRLLARRFDLPVVFAAARLSRRVFARLLAAYRVLSFSPPKKIFAVSRADKERYSLIWPGVTRYADIFFDILQLDRPIAYVQNPLSSILKPNSQFLLFSKVTGQESLAMIQVVVKILQERTRIILGICPDDPAEVHHWQHMCASRGIKCFLRSNTTRPLPQGSLLIFDQGDVELEAAYALAKAVVLGQGCDFSERRTYVAPLQQGVIPLVQDLDISGWGRDLANDGLVHLVSVKQSLDTVVLMSLKNNLSRQKIVARWHDYVQTRRQGYTLEEFV